MASWAITDRAAAPAKAGKKKKTHKVVGLFFCFTSLVASFGLKVGLKILRKITPSRIIQLKIIPFGSIARVRHVFPSRGYVFPD